MNGDAHKVGPELKAVVILVLAAVAGVAIFGTGSHMGHFEYPVEASASRLATKLVELELAPELSDQVLKQTLQAVMDRAAEGDVEAAAFVFELASLQRATHRADEAP